MGIKYQCGSFFNAVLLSVEGLLLNILFSCGQKRLKKRPVQASVVLYIRHMLSYEGAEDVLGT